MYYCICVVSSVNHNKKKLCKKKEKKNSKGPK